MLLLSTPPAISLASVNVLGDMHGPCHRCPSTPLHVVPFVTPLSCMSLALSDCPNDSLDCGGQRHGWYHGIRFSNAMQGQTEVQ
jgi:hypothetical protein